jgi:hypothetical protein
MREEFTDIIPAHRVEEMSVIKVRVTCDGCKKDLGTLYGTYDPDASHLLLGLNEGECVSFVRERDYCIVCLEPIWVAINKAIGADPDVEREDLGDAEDSQG